MAKCSKCKQKKQLLYKRGGFKLCKDCLPSWDKNSNMATVRRNRTMMNDVNELADKIGMPRL